MAEIKPTTNETQPTTATVAANQTGTETVDTGFDTTTDAPNPRTTEAKSRFNSALDEAKAGAAALGDEAKVRAGKYREDAKVRGDEWSADAKMKASELAVDGKHKASEALSGLSRMIDENTATVDEKLGAKYGDYARSASRTLQENARKLDEKSLDELAEDSREAIRKSPATAVGLAAVVGFFFARLFR
ncbi:MAG: hypothetical protein WBA68_09825 [Alteraurantiacibacter sp.]